MVYLVLLLLLAKKCSDAIQYDTVPHSYLLLLSEIHHHHSGFHL